MPKWTEAQRNAIYSRGGTLLVRAAAGSGKTAVLVERVVSMLTDAENPVDADRLLVATFSNAAAGELRERISARIDELTAREEDAGRLRRQQLLLERAQIGTVHAFCLRLIRENLDRLGLQSDLRIADAAEMAQLKKDAADELLEAKYKEAKPEFLYLVELLSDGRSDRRLTDTLLRLYDFVRAHPFYDEWLGRMLELYDPQQGVERSAWGRIILEYAVTAMSYVLKLSDEALEDVYADEKLTAAYAASFEAASFAAEKLIERAQDGRWDEIYSLLREFSLPPLKPLRSDGPDFVKERLKESKAEIKKIFEELAERQFCATDAEFREDVAVLRPVIAELFATVLEYDGLLQKKKQSASVMDFSDMEQYALRLLYNREGGVCERSETAKSCASRFEAIFVDEYQDTNAAQDMIFQAVSRDGGNIFMVGDVKQSIYRFRQAMPEIFIAKKERFSPFGQGVYPANIVLSRNFRSLPAVLRATNFIFERLMSREIGEIEYDGEERLVPDDGKPDEGGELGCVDFTLLDLSEDESEEKAAYTEAAYIASEIKRMLAEGYTVYGRDGARPAKAGDFAVLLRSRAGRIGHYLRAFAAAGLTADAENEGDFFDAPEVSLMVSLLRVVDNPLSDIALTAALMSELFGFTPSDMARLRLARRDTPLYACLGLLADENDERCAAAHRLLSRFRLMSSALPVDMLIRRIYDATDLTAMMIGSDNGAERVANLRRLIRIAADFEARSQAGLGGFLRYIDRMKEDGAGIGSGGFSADGSDSVRIMSIHASKGLEFPIVFLADTAKRFNRMDLYSKTLLHPEYGFSCVRRDPERGVQFTTVQQEALKLTQEASMMSEELRILYVAMTRARDKLIITAAVSNAKKSAARAAFSSDGGTVLPYLVRGAASVSEWLIRALIAHPDGKPLRDCCEGFSAPVYPDGNNSRWRITITPPVKSEAAEDNTGAAALSEDETVRLIAESAARRYAYAYAQAIPNKLSVSELSHPQKSARDFGRTPSFMVGGELTAAQRGTAAHTFMQFADYARAEKSISEELDRMRDEGYLTAAQRDSVDEDRLACFFKSALYARMKRSKELYREFRFLYNARADSLGFKGGDTVTIQGVADCLFIEDGGLVVVDYKTDRVREPSQLVERYRRQLEIYAEVLSQSFGAPVREAVIYSLSLDCEAVVPLAKPEEM